jgi:hypothetical protein
MKNEITNLKNVKIGHETAVPEALESKLMDALTPGFWVECDPDEAALAGAFREDALSELDATGSELDGPDSLDGNQHHKEEGV